MANILILGASCQIGQELAVRFSGNNTLYLCGRNQLTLDLIANKCLESGAEKVTVVCCDLSTGMDQIFEAVVNSQLNLIINLVAATSRTMDDDFAPQLFESYIFSDLLVPIQLVKKISINSKKHPDVIFISSVLASIKSPNKEMYSALKILQEIYWERLFRQNNSGSLLIVRVGKKIPYSASSFMAKDLANKTYKNYKLSNNVLNYGWEGKLYLLLFHLHPILSQWLIRAHRAIRIK